jgi:hypothetical protein
MDKKASWIGVIIAIVLCLVSIITSIMTLNCLADQKYTCAQASGFTALVTGCMIASACAVVVYQNK